MQGKKDETVLVATTTAMAFGDTVAERERRTDEIAAWLPAGPKADGARIGDRAAWGRLAAMPEAKEAVAQAEELLSRPIPEVTDERYLDFTRNGNRIDYETPFFARETNLGRLLLAECLENKGRFLPKIVEYIMAMCAERSWTGPAHDPKLTCFNGKPHVDLFAAQRAFALAQTCDWLRDVRFKVKSAQDKVENDFFTSLFMIVDKDGSDSFVDFPAPSEEWEPRFAFLGTNGALASAVAIRIGGNPCGTDLTYWIRDLEILRPRVVK